MTAEKEKSLSGHAFKALFKKWGRKPMGPDTALVVPDSVEDLSISVNMSSEKQRLDSSLKHAHLQKGEKNHDDDVGVEAELHLERASCTKSKLDMDIECQHDECAICMNTGTLLHCNGQGCKRSFHLPCVNPPLSYVPPGVWHCSWCTERKIKFGLHSVSEGIESIRDAREVVLDHEDTQGQKEYLVKYKSLAHVHNRWISEIELVSEASVLITKFNKRNQIIKNNIEWSVPHRLLDKRLILLPRNDINVSDCHYEWLVKWKGLSYDQASWELENASFLRTPEAMRLIDDFESRHKESSTVSHPPKKHELQGRESTFTELLKLPLQGSPDICNFNLTYVNKLREYWHRGQNCLVIDHQERVMKVVLFILSFHTCLKQPFLIITASSALPLWEAQFSRWASSENIVVYKGNKDIRSSIKTLEFYSEGGCIMFQVLITLPEVVVEDLEVLVAIKWEAIIIDECQHGRVWDCLTQLKMLAADMRLLLVSHEIEDRRFNYQAVLSLLDSEFDQPAHDIEPNLNICDLKERLSQFLAFECKSGISKFAEYWVPVHLSNVQIEQYCESLLSNTVTLCSNSKNDLVCSLPELLTLTRKCCDHPSLVDHSVQSFLTTDLPEADHLDVGIKISGKLQLLDKVLTETKKRSLKVLIMFQSLGGSGQISSIGDILSDFVHQRFGQDSYTRIDREIIRLKKSSVLDIFNAEDSEKFVCLIERRACRSSIKFSSLDMVILFGSDWNPRNDLRALQKITIRSQFDQIKVLRFYSSFTVEEQILISAKQGATLDSNMMNISRSTCHSLLNWGAHCLFDKLDIFHNCDLPVSQLNNESQVSLLDDVFLELLAIFPQNCEACDSTSCSIISPVQQIEGAYKSNIMLLGEMEFQSMQNLIVIKQIMDDEPSHVLWTSLLEGREHKWKYLPEPSSRKRKKVQRHLDLPEEFGTEVVPCKRKRSREISKILNQTVFGTRLTNRRKIRTKIGKTRLAGITLPFQLSASPLHQQPCFPTPPNPVPGQPIVELSILTSDLQPAPSLPPQLSRVNSISGNQLDDSYCRSADIIFEHGNDNPQQPMTSEALRCTPLQMELENGKKYIEQATKTYQDMKLRLISDRDKEIAELQKKYGALFQQAEMTSKRHMDDLKTRYTKLYMNELLAEAFRQMNNLHTQDLSLALQKEGHLCGQPETVTTPVHVGDDQSFTEQHMIAGHMNQLGRMVNQSPVTYPATEMMFQQDASGFGLHCQQSSASLPITTPGPRIGTSSMEAVILSSPIHESARNIPQFSRSPVDHVTGLGANPAMQSVIQGSVLSADSQMPLNIPTIQHIPKFTARNQFRTISPAPHMRHSIPSSPLHNPPSYLNLLPNL